MIVYLIGHGFVVPHFSSIKVIPPNCDLKFYVPEGQLPEDFIREKGGEWTLELVEEFEQRQALSLYDGPRTAYYIWNDGEAIMGIEGIPEKTQKEEKTSEGVQLVEAPIHEHLLHSIEFSNIREDLTGVNYRVLEDIGDWEKHQFKVCEVGSVTLLTGQHSEKAPQSQYIVTPSWNLGDCNKYTAYRLSWLIRILPDLRDRVGLLDDEPIHICWLACRTAMGGHDSESFMDQIRDDGGKDEMATCITDNIYPR